MLRINLRYGTPVDLHRGAEFHRVAAVDVWSAVAQTLDSIENFKFQNVSSGAEARFDLDFLSELKHRPRKSVRLDADFGGVKTFGGKEIA